MTAATCSSRWVSTPTVTALAGAGMLSMAVPSGCSDRHGTHPSGRSTALRWGLSPGSYRVTPPDRWVPSDALQQLADRSTSRHQAGETSGQTSHRGHPPASSQ
jgi:hypothetical protein